MSAVARLWIVAGLIAALGLGLSGCGSKNGSTTCGDYRGMSTSDKITTVTNMVKNTGKPSPTPASVELARASVTAYCFMHSASDPISNIYKG